MSEIGSGKEVFEAKEAQLERDGFKEIKPQEGTTFQEAQDFWKDMFGSEIQSGGMGVEGKEAETSTESFDKIKLTDEEKNAIREETGWSDEIADAIGSREEYEVYKKAGLEEAEVNDKKCLIQNDIDWEQKDVMNRTNKERIEQGLSPLNKDGKVLELHHIGQHADSPLAELTLEEHRGKENYLILHDKTKESEIDRQIFAGERSEYWEARANQGGTL